MNFASDNTAGAAPAVLAALTAAAAGAAPAYGDDALTRRVEARIAERFEHDCRVFLVTTGGAANGLALATLTPPWGTVLCHPQSHANTDECAGPEFFGGGLKLTTIDAAMPADRAGQVDADGLRAALASRTDHHPHTSPACTLTITQATECGTVYTPAALAALCDSAHAAGLRVHMDGARFANAVVAAGASPAELTWRAGVDVLSLGATKNGCLAAEAVVFFDPDLAAGFEYRRKRAGHLLSKMRFIAAQLDAWLADDHWLALAAHANAMARRLAAGLCTLDGVHPVWPTEANEVFVYFPAGVQDRLRAAGARFYPWVVPGGGAAPPTGVAARLIASFQTTADEVDAFLQLARTVIATA